MAPTVEGATKETGAAGVQGHVPVADVPALVQRLRLAIGLAATALEHSHVEWQAPQLARQGQAGGASADNTDIGLDPCPMCDAASVDKHVRAMPRVNHSDNRWLVGRGSLRSRCRARSALRGAEVRIGRASESSAECLESCRVRIDELDARPVLDRCADWHDD